MSRRAAIFAVTVLVVVAVFAIGSTPRTAQPVARTVTVRVPGTYRGETAAQWASRYRHRTRQFQAAISSVKAVIRPGYGSSWHERAFLCIHSHEGSWTDPRPPYYGGLQMDLPFQRHYGAWALDAFGTADHWPNSVQLAVAIQAEVSGRGFGPWPNTRKLCGL